MSINLTFPSRDIHNTTVVDGDTNEILFEIDTPSGFGSRTTTITDPIGKVVGVYERRLGADRVTVRGRTMKLGDWMPSTSIFTR